MKGGILMYNYKTKVYPNGSAEVKLYNYSVGASLVQQPTDSFDSLDFVEEPFTGGRVPASRMDTDEEARMKAEHSQRTSRNRTISKIYDLANSNVWTWFVAMTFDPSKVDRFSYEDCSDKLSKWLNHLRTADSAIGYLFVPEQHKDGAWHFHGFLFDSPSLQMIDSGHKDGSGRTIYNIGRYSFGFTTATMVGNNEAAVKYMTKYITKDLISLTKGKKRYWASRNLAMPQEDTFFIESEEKARLDYEYTLDCQGKKEIPVQYGFQNRTVTCIKMTADCLQVPNEYQSPEERNST